MKQPPDEALKGLIDLIARNAEAYFQNHFDPKKAKWIITTSNGRDKLVELEMPDGTRVIHFQERRFVVVGSRVIPVRLSREAGAPQPKAPTSESQP